MGAFVLLAGSADVRGQSIGPSTINANGGSGTIGSSRFEWSVGELAWVSPTTGSAIVTQGVLQPSITLVSVGSAMLATQMQVYPNPSASIVNIKLAAPTDGTLSYRLMDVAGRVVLKKAADIKQGTSIHQLDISQLAVASYMLQLSFITDGKTEEIATYQLQKLQ